MNLYTERSPESYSLDVLRTLIFSDRYKIQNYLKLYLFGVNKITECVSEQVIFRSWNRFDYFII